MIGSKAGILNENTRKHMIMSQEIKDAHETDTDQNGGDGSYTPLNMSRTDEMGLETRRNPIETEFSRQQQDDCRRSMGFQSSLQDAHENANIN